MDKQRLFGGNPIGVVVRLVVLSIIVGIVLSALNVRPENLVWHVRLLLRRIYDLGFGAIGGLIDYFLLGAVVVIPIWLIARLLGAMRRRGGG
jgi:hypothetical protein